MPKVGMEPVRRKALVDAALRVIGDHGSLTVTMSEIARQAGVSPALAHHYFGSKEGLFREAVALNAATQGLPPRLALREQPTAYAAIDAMLRAVADTITLPDSPRGCMLVLAAPTGAIENHAVRELLAGARRAQFSEIRDRLTKGVTDGDLDVALEKLDGVARYYTTVMHGLSVWGPPLDVVQVTRNRSRSGARRGTRVHAHSAPLSEDEIVVVDGVACTCLARTVVDLPGRRRSSRR